MGESKRKRAKQIASKQVAGPRPLVYDEINKPKKATRRAGAKPHTPKKTRLDGGQDDAAALIKQSGSWKLAGLSARLWMENYKVCLVLFVLPGLMFAVARLLAPDITDISNRTLAGVILATAALSLIFIQVPIAYYLQSRVIRGDKPGLKESYRQGLRNFLRLAGLALLVALLVGVGLLMFIIPGVILLRRYFLAPYYLLDQNLGIRQAMNRSAADSKAVSMYIWGVLGVTLVVATLSFALLGRVFPPFGAVISSFLTSLFVFLPALRYREVALRQTASSLFEPVKS